MSPRRTFTNYFSGKEEAIAYLNADRAARAAQTLADRPAGEPLADALAEAFAAQHQGRRGRDGPAAERRGPADDDLARAARGSTSRRWSRPKGRWPK